MAATDLLLGSRAISRRVGAARRTFAADRRAFESWAQAQAGPGSRSDSPSNVRALLAVVGIARAAASSVLLLSHHSAVRASPVAGDITKARRRLVAASARLPLHAAGSVLQRGTSQLAAGLVDLLNAEHALLNLLAQVGRAEVADYFGGLDDRAAYPSYRRSAANRGQCDPFTKDALPSDDVTQTRLGALIWPTAVIDRDGDLYTGHAEGQFVALHPGGRVKWRLSDPQMMYVDSTGALGRDGFLYLASTDADARGHQNQGRLWKVDPATGDVVWTFWSRHFEDPEADPNAHLSGFFEGNVALGLERGELTVYAGSDDNHLYKVDERGELVWDYDTGFYPAGVIWTKPLLSPDGSTVYIGDMSGHVHAVRTGDGSRAWVTDPIPSTPSSGCSADHFSSSSRV